AGHDVSARRRRRNGPVLRGSGRPRRAIVGALMTQVPFRDTFWNVPGWAQVALYVGALVAIAVFAYGMWQRITLWRAGGPENRFDHVPQRLRLVALHALGQARTLSQAYPGVMHATMFWGFLALFMGTVLATVDYDITLPLFGYKLLKGDFYLFYETVLDLFGLFFVIGLGMAVWRRFVVRPHNVDPTARFAAVLAFLFGINVSGFVMEAAARLRRLRGMRALPGRVPRVPVGNGAQPQAHHREAEATSPRRAGRTDPRRADQARRAVGVHDVHGLRAGVPGLHRHRRHDHRSPPLPGAVGGRLALDGAAIATEHPA